MRRGPGDLPIVRLPEGLAGRPGQIEVAAGGDGNVGAVGGARDLREAALVVAGAADACAGGRVLHLSQATCLQGMHVSGLCRKGECGVCAATSPADKSKAVYAGMCVKQLHRL